ncbi:MULTISPECIES: hypothetical protein [Streptomyces]|uniref:hypothetical protein n=1 Tax=Streptomyces TaxID=1883 RepID=UPI001319F758|nr:MULTISPECIES: hypothetical protein [Streptomyces]MZD16961.1 hypothetical protein [Streptomyces sp. SID5476]
MTINLWALELRCIETSRGGGDDEAYMMFNGQVLWGPQGMEGGSVVDLSHIHYNITDRDVQVRLREEDTFEDDDLGSQAFSKRDYDPWDNQVRTTKFALNGANYDFRWIFESDSWNP